MRAGRKNSKTSTHAVGTPCRLKFRQYRRLGSKHSVVMKRYLWTYNRVGHFPFAERRCARKLAAFDTSDERAALLDCDGDPAGKTGVILLGLNPANAILLKSWNRRGYRVSINALRCSVSTNCPTISSCARPHPAAVRPPLSPASPTPRRRSHPPSNGASSTLRAAPDL